MNNKKFSYCTQKNTQCNENAQLWYFVNAMQKAKTSKNPVVRIRQSIIANYYLNGKVKSY